MNTEFAFFGLIFTMAYLTNSTITFIGGAFLLAPICSTITPISPTPKTASITSFSIGTTFTTAIFSAVSHNPTSLSFKRFTAILTRYCLTSAVMNTCTFCATACNTMSWNGCKRFFKLFAANRTIKCFALGLNDVETLFRAILPASFIVQIGRFCTKTLPTMLTNTNNLIRFLRHSVIPSLYNPYGDDQAVD